MAFDQRGQAETVERRGPILGRAYDLLIEQAGFASEDIILGTSSPWRPASRHAGFAKAFIEAIRS
jgi:5-methyltetrahydrofolate--homocysteine methyltransferase